MQCKNGMYFSFDVGWYSIDLDIDLRIGGGVGVGCVGFFLLLA